MTIFSSLYGARLDRELGSADSTILFTTARRQSAINEAQQEFAAITECIQRQSTITIVAGVGEYDLNQSSVVANADFIRFSREGVAYRFTDAAGNVQWLAGDDLPRRDVPWLNRYQPGWQTSTVASTTSQLPALYYQRPDGGAYFLGFTPVPGLGSSEAAAAIVPYIARPTPMTSDTQEPFTFNGAVRSDLRIYHQGLVHYAAAMLEKLRRDVQASQMQMQQFLSYVSRYLGEVRPKGGAVLTYTRHYFNVRGQNRGTDPRR